MKEIRVLNYILLEAVEVISLSLLCWLRPSFLHSCSPECCGASLQLRKRRHR